MNEAVTLRFLMENMKFVEYTHVVVREKTDSGMLCSAGGGYPDKIIKRFGNYEVKRSSIIDSILYIDVKVPTSSLN